MKVYTSIFWSFNLQFCLRQNLLAANCERCAGNANKYLHLRVMRPQWGISRVGAAIAFRWPLVTVELARCKKPTCVNSSQTLRAGPFPGSPASELAQTFHRWIRTHQPNSCSTARRWTGCLPSLSFGHLPSQLPMTETAFLPRSRLT